MSRAGVPSWFEDGPGNGPVLLLANPLGSTLAIWDRIVGALSRDHRVVRFDLRGHGGTPASPGPYEVADLGRDLLGVIDSVGARGAAICGISIGAMGAMWLAAHAPERVDRLVLCCSAARLGTPSGWAERAALVRTAGMGAVAEAVAGRWVTPGWAAAHPEQMARLRAMVASTDGAAYAEWCLALGRADLGPELGAVAAPTLVIGGSDDPAVPPAGLRALADGIADARLAIIPGAAHSPSLEQPRAMSDLLLSHLDPVRAGRP
ncbi:MAG: 3-oxoadipate enol-lactonase [Candidatus Limnocylindrales bacterium]